MPAETPNQDLRVIQRRPRRASPISTVKPTKEIRMSATIGNSAGATAIRPYTIPKVPEAELEALRARIAATRWPTKELVADRSQGVQLAMVQELARYWTTDYDWRACEARLNALPQFKTEID